jgi:hypothetical protein
VAISIEILLDLNAMSIEVATGHLCAVEERKKKPTSAAKEGRLLLTEEEWMARLKAREGESSSGGRGGRGRGMCVGHGGRGRGSSTDSNEEYRQLMSATPVVSLVIRLSSAGQVEAMRFI